MLQTAGITGRSQLLASFEDLGIRQIILSLKSDHKSLTHHIIEFQTTLAQDLYLKRKYAVSSRGRTNSSGANQSKRHDEMFEYLREMSGSESWRYIGFSSESPKKDFFSKTGHLGLETLCAIVLVLT